MSVRRWKNLVGSGVREKKASFDKMANLCHGAIDLRNSLVHMAEGFLGIVFCTGFWAEAIWRPTA